MFDLQIQITGLCVTKEEQTITREKYELRQKEDLSRYMENETEINPIP